MLRIPTSLALLLLLVAPSAAQNCANTSTGNVPLMDLVGGSYLGFPGGLYAPSSNARPLQHEYAGMAQAALVVPRLASGAPASGASASLGKIGFVSIGMSNASQEFTRFVQLVASDPDVAPAVVAVNGAQGGVSAADMADPAAPYWTLLLSRVQQADLTPEQVQVLWIKQANAQPTDPFPQHAQILKNDVGDVVRNAKALFPNARIAYLNSRSYAGYATGPLNPEPWAYEQGYAMKWLISDQVAGAPELRYEASQGAVVAPWLSWGVYGWADGLVPRSDGLVWECSDFAPDGVHPSAAGRTKMAQLLLTFLKSDPLSASWFVADPTPHVYGEPKVTSLGTLPRLSWSGAPEPGGDFHITLSGGTPNQSAILLRSPRPAHAPFEGGWRLVAHPISRLAVIQLDEDGEGAWSIDVAPLANQLRFHQSWLCDPAHPDGTGVALSDGLMVRF